MAIVPATPLANPQFAIPDFATPLAQALGAIQQKRQQTQAADLGEQAFEADDLETRNKALLKLSQIDPRMAQAASGMLGMQDEAARAERDAETNAFGEFASAVYRLDSKPERDAFIKAEIRRRMEEGKPFDRLEEMLGMTDTQQRATALSYSVGTGQMKELFAADDARMAALRAQQPGTEQRFFEDLTADLSPQEREQARRVRLGLAPRMVGSGAQTIAQTGATGDVAASRGQIVGAETAAREQAQAEASVQARQEANQQALTTYEQAMGGLMRGLGGADTGPLVGMLPALTANQQVAEGAVSAMAPVLKTIFRVAGEGTFTDRDQAILTAMIPTRKDHPEARAQKLANVDAIVRSKLGGQFIPAPQAALDELKNAKDKDAALQEFFATFKYIPAGF